MTGTPQKITIINSDEKPIQGDFIVRKLSPTSYNIEESNTPIEITDKNTLLVAMAFVNNMDNHPKKAKMETKEYMYRTKNNIYLKFTVKDGQLMIEPT